jgi:hypothetical protein
MIRVIDGQPYVCIPLVERPPRIDHRRLIESVVRRLAADDPAGEGQRPADLLRALDNSGEQWFEGRPWHIRLARFTTHLCSELKASRPQLARDQRRYRIRPKYVVITDGWSVPFKGDIGHLHAKLRHGTPVPSDRTRTG